MTLSHIANAVAALGLAGLFVALLMLVLPD